MAQLPITGVRKITVDYWVCSLRHHHVDQDKAERCEARHVNKKIKKRFTHLPGNNWERMGSSVTDLLASLRLIREYVEHGTDYYNEVYEYRYGDSQEAEEFLKLHGVRVQRLYLSKRSCWMVNTSDLKATIEKLGKKMPKNWGGTKEIKVTV